MLGELLSIKDSLIGGASLAQACHDGIFDLDALLDEKIKHFLSVRPDRHFHGILRLDAPVFT